MASPRNAPFPTKKRTATFAKVSSTAMCCGTIPTTMRHRNRMCQPQCYSPPPLTTSSYKHAVIQNLIDDKLLRNVRNEIREHISFTPKETDIYKIHQSGDLANLDGLDDAALKRLPSLLTLRDSLYSSAFRKYLSSITGSGPLSGVKTDMAVVGYA